MAYRATTEGHSMLLESLEQHANSNVAVSKGHAVPRTGGGLRLLDFVNRSTYLKLLWICLVAQQLPTALAKGICATLASIGPNFDLIGLISAFGTGASTKSMSYSALNDSCFYLTGHVGPGTLNVAATLFQATDFPLARLLAFGGEGEDTCDLANLGAPNGLRYVGLKFDTAGPIGNGVGASIVREHGSLWNRRNEGDAVEDKGRPVLGRQVGRDAKRRLELLVLKVEGEDPRDKTLWVSLKSAEGSAFFVGWLPLLLTIAVILSCCNCGQWVVAGILSFGTLAMMIAVLGLRLCQFKYSESKQAENSSEGDILVVDETDSEVLHMIKGTEDTIQKLFQRKIVFEASFGKYVLFLAASMLYIHVFVSVLCMSNVDTSGQIHFAVANLIGLGADMVKASRNGQLGLAKKACEKFRIVEQDKILFLNRTAAVTYVARHAKDRGTLKTKKLLPSDGRVWQTWWDILAASAPVVQEPEASKKEHDLLALLLDDMKDGLEAK